MDLASIILGASKTGRLEQELVLKQQIAQEVSVANYSQVQGSIFQIAITGQPGQTVDALEAAAWPVIQSLATGPVTAEELSRAERSWEANMLRGLEQIGGFGGKADMLNYYNFIAGDAGYLPKDFARHQAVTAESLQKVYAETVKATNRVVVQVVPEGGAK